jgi:hypothetical protein
MEDKPTDPNAPEGDRRREDIERLKKALREIADRLSSANSALKKAADKQRERKERAARAAEQLKKALDELRKRREGAMIADNAPKSHKTPAPQQGVDGKAKSHPNLPASCDKQSECALPTYKGDFTSEYECQRLTNLPPITEDEIRNTNWDLLWKFMDF